MITTRTTDWIETFSGKRFFPLEPRPEDVCIEDIAHALSMQCRFGGHTRHFHSVAYHSLIVSFHCKQENALWGLLHDAAEAYLVDVPRPVKYSVEMEGYRAAEVAIMACVCQKFDLPLVEPADVHEADNAVLLAEKRDLMGKLAWAGTTAKPIPNRILLVEPFLAKEYFLKRYKELTNAGK